MFNWTKTDTTNDDFYKELCWKYSALVSDYQQQLVMLIKEKDGWEEKAVRMLKWKTSAIAWKEVSEITKIERDNWKDLSMSYKAQLEKLGELK